MYAAIGLPGLLRPGRRSECERRAFRSATDWCGSCPDASWLCLASRGVDLLDRVRGVPPLVLLVPVLPPLFFAGSVWFLSCGSSWCGSAPRCPASTLLLCLLQSAVSARVLDDLFHT